MKLLPQNILMICINNDTLSHKRTSVNSQSSVQSSTAPANRNDNKVTIPDEEQMNRNLKALQGEFDDNHFAVKFVKRSIISKCPFCLLAF